MSSKGRGVELRNRILQGVSQFEVDFVIPLKGVDLPLGIDPFLLFKSRDPEFAALHDLLLTVFNAGVGALREGNAQQARYLLDFPEVAEIGLGYTQRSKRGAGVGTYLTELIIETLKDSPTLMARGVRHVEELQLVAAGIGPDRISDITANVLKKFLIEYTQRQCEQWSIPVTSGVPVSHIFDRQQFKWTDGHFDLPVSEVDQSAILLVPRRLVRALPWINYDEFFRLEFAAYHRSKRVRSRLQSKGDAAVAPLAKEEVTAVTRAQIERVDRYIAIKEKAASEAQPSLAYIDVRDVCPEAESLKARLAAIPTGREHAVEFQRVTLAILNYLFNPELIDGELEVKTVEGTERRDIIFTNDSDRTFWSYLRTEHSSVILMFETKNMSELGADAYNQVGNYLGERLGRLGFIVTRSAPSEANQRKAFSIYNDSHPKKVVLVLSDVDVIHMLDEKCRGDDPMRYLQKLYRQFRTSVQ